MNLQELRIELERDEGVKYEIYLDHLGLATFGIGHLIRTDDPEYGQPVGTPVTEERVEAAFQADMEIVIKDCHNLYDDFEELPETAKRVIANMCFNLGYPRLSKFKGMKRGVDARDWNAAAEEMGDSRWYRQVTKRADRLVERMRDLA